MKLTKVHYDRLSRLSSFVDAVMVYGGTVITQGEANEIRMGVAIVDDLLKTHRKITLDRLRCSMIKENGKVIQIVSSSY